MKHRKLLVIASAIALVALFFAAARYYQSRETARIGFLAEENASLFVPGYAPHMGSENGPVYVVEFLDPECESCRAFYPHVKQIMSDYKDDITLVIRYAPFHRNSKFAVKILEAARKQDKYWQTLEVLFANQPAWASHHDPKPELIWSYLPELGLDVEQIKKDMNDPEIEKRIEQDIKDGRELGVKATPSFFVNGKPLEKFGPDHLRNLIEQELKQAE